MDLIERIVLRCDGMLSPAAYRAVYEAGRRGGLIVEVGTALGAGTAALASGLRDSGLPGRVISFDPMEGGPRRQISTVQARVAHVRGNLEHFGVGDLVDIVPSTLPKGLDRLPAGDPVSVLMLDADGRLDRDLLAIFDRLAPDCAIIIDDLADKVRLKRAGVFSYSIDSKMRLAFSLVRILKEDDAITPGSMIKETYFGAKGAGRVDPLRMLEGYRDLVFTTARLTPVGMVRRFAVRRLEALAPGLLQRLRLRKRQAIQGPHPAAPSNRHSSMSDVARAQSPAPSPIAPSNRSVASISV